MLFSAPKIGPPPVADIRPGGSPNYFKISFLPEQLELSVNTGQFSKSRPRGLAFPDFQDTLPSFLRIMRDLPVSLSGKSKSNPRSIAYSKIVKKNVKEMTDSLIITQ
jgi:hypothetical protein